LHPLPPLPPRALQPPPSPTGGWRCSGRLFSCTPAPQNAGLVSSASWCGWDRVGALVSAGRPASAFLQDGVGAAGGAATGAVAVLTDLGLPADDAAPGEDGGLRPEPPAPSPAPGTPLKGADEVAVSRAFFRLWFSKTKRGEFGELPNKSRHSLYHIFSPWYCPSAP